MRIAAIALLATLAAGAADAAQVYKWTDEKGVVHYTDDPPPDRAFEKKTVNTPPPATGGSPASAGMESSDATPPPAPGSDAANCAQARKNIELIEKNPNLGADRDGDGTIDKLTDEERAAEIAKQQKLADAFCPPAADAG